MFPGSSSCSPCRFQPTYEELKLILTLYIVFKIICFQPTYEELKHFRPIQMVLELDSFQPTYEELKQAGFEFVKFDFVVFSLPMRN